MSSIDLTETFTASLPDPRESRFSKIIIYGAGNMGKKVFSTLKKEGKTILAFLDIRASGDSSYDGVPILPPNHDSIKQFKAEDTLIVIAIFNFDVELEPVVQLVRQLGFKHILTFAQFHHHFVKEIGEHFWLGSRTLYHDHKEDLQKVLDLLSDEESREVFRSILKFRITGDHTVLGKHEGMRNQYFTTTVPALQKPIRFMDIGAFDGDTLAAMVALGIEAEAIACFEPDLKNFKKLSEYCKTHSQSFKELNLFPCAAWSTTEYLSFSADNSVGSHVNKSGTGNSALAVSIDEIIPTFRPTYIKMDIEGAEVSGLMGVLNTIRNYEPDLGICLYHAPDHLWKIPLLIKSLNLPYTFHLRPHAFNGFELVFYARKRVLQ